MSSILEKSPGDPILSAEHEPTPDVDAHRIDAVEIQNYKSVRNLKLDLGRFTVLIGENGCGKSNILEAIALGGAAAARKLDHEFLASRGIRVTDPPLMRSAFENATANKDVRLIFHFADEDLGYSLSDRGGPYSTWSCRFTPRGRVSPAVAMVERIARVLLQHETGDDIRTLLEHFGYNSDDVAPILEALGSENDLAPAIQQFLIYSPENTALRTFEAEGQIEPLGIRGEGLFKLLSVFAREEGEQRIKRLNELLKLVDWFKELALPGSLAPGQQSLSIKDRFLEGSQIPLDQRSANEGFLYLLFYFALFISDRTPPFFAIDNIEASLNPKLCAEVTRILVRLSKEQDKRVIVTTHNPAILDGLDLEDPEQRLLVVYRNSDGHTVANQVRPLRPLRGQDPVRLSEAFIRGYLGGLPRNF